jgi:hypothetical protein
LTDRLNCFQYLVDFEPKKVDIMPDISTLEKCSTFVSTNEKIAKFLEVIFFCEFQKFLKNIIERKITFSFLKV